MGQSKIQSTDQLTNTSMPSHQANIKHNQKAADHIGRPTIHKNPQFINNNKQAKTRTYQPRHLYVHANRQKKTHRASINTRASHGHASIKDINLRQGSC